LSLYVAAAADRVMLTTGTLLFLSPPLKHLPTECQNLRLIMRLIIKKLNNDSEHFAGWYENFKSTTNKLAGFS